MADDTRWFEITAKLGVTASLVDNQLRDDELPPLSMAGGFLYGAARLSERYEKLITLIGRGAADRLDPAAIDGLRTALQHLQAARTALDDTVVPSLDPHRRGHVGPPDYTGGETVVHHENET